MEKEAEEDNQYRQQLEQERRDHELAMRLAQESNSQVDDSPLLLRKYDFFKNKAMIFNATATEAGLTDVKLHFLHIDAFIT